MNNDNLVMPNLTRKLTKQNNITCNKVKPGQIENN